MAQKALGTKLQIGTTYIAELTSIKGMDVSADTIETTTLDSVDGWRTFMQGMRDAGEVSVEGFFNNSDAGQTAVYNAFTTGTENNFIITFPSPMSITWNFNGVITAVSTGSDMESAVSFSATIKVSGKPTLGVTTAVSNMTGLTLANGTLTPTFTGSKYAYYGAITGATTSVTVTSTAPTINLYVNNVFLETLTSGTASSDISLSTSGTSKALTIVLLEPGKAQKIYDIVIVRS